MTCGPRGAGSTGASFTTATALQSRASEIGYDRLRNGHGGLARKKGVRIFGADRLRQRPFRRGRQHRKALDGNLGHGRLKEPVALYGVPGHREGARILDVNVHLQRLTAVDQVEALDHVKLLGVRRPESVYECPVVKPDRVDDERIAFVVADGFAVPGCLDVVRMPVCQIDSANVIEACQY